MNLVKVIEGWLSTSSCWEAVIKPMENRGKRTMKWQIIHDSWKTKNKILKLLVLLYFFNWISHHLLFRSSWQSAVLGRLDSDQSIDVRCIPHPRRLSVRLLFQPIVGFLSVRYGNSEYTHRPSNVCYLKLYRWRTFAEIRKFYHVFNGGHPNTLLTKFPNFFHLAIKWCICVHLQVAVAWNYFPKHVAYYWHICKYCVTYIIYIQTIA